MAEPISMDDFRNTESRLKFEAGLIADDNEGIEDEVKYINKSLLEREEDESHVTDMTNEEKILFIRATQIEDEIDMISKRMNRIVEKKTNIGSIIKKLQEGSIEAHETDEGIGVSPKDVFGETIGKVVEGYRTAKRLKETQDYYMTLFWFSIKRRTGNFTAEFKVRKDFEIVEYGDSDETKILIGMLEE